MIVKNAEFITSQTDYSPVVDLAEIAVVGRSNAGKSSLINMLARQKKLARTSSEPGRTRLINYFKFVTDIEPFVLVDLPGYGFAKGSKSETARWGAMIEKYLGASDNLKNTFVLMDIRHEPSLNDRIMLDYLYKTAKPFTVVATKADKLPRTKVAAAVGVIASTLGLGRDDIIVTSAEKKLGGDKLLERIERILVGAKDLQDDGLIEENG